MRYLVLLAIAAGLFLGLPWLAVAFGRYCGAVNRFVRRRAQARVDAEERTGT